MVLCGYNTFILILANILCVKNICLDPTQIDGNCSSCMPTQVLLQKTCFEKLRGCLDYSLVNNSLRCIICQNGYEIANSICQRKIITDLVSDDLTKNSPPPIVIDNREMLNLSNINISPNSSINITKIDKMNTTSVIIFPQVTIIKEDLLSQKHSDTKDLQQIIIEQYKDLNGQKFTFVPQSPHSQQYVLAVSAMGSVLLLQMRQNKSSDRERSNLKQEKGQRERRRKCQYTVTYLFQLKNLQQAIKKTKTIPGELGKLSLAFNYQYKVNENETVLLNIDIASSKIKVICSNGQSLQWEAFLSAKFHLYSKWSYYQFLQKSNLINLATHIVKIEAESKEKQVIYFKFYYGQSQYSYMKYSLTNNKTDIIGYFVEGENILTVIKSITDNSTQGQSKLLNQDEKSLNDSLPSKDVNLVYMVGKDKMFPNKPLLGISQSSTIKSENKLSEMKSMWSSSAQYTEYIKNTVQFRQKFLQNYRILWIRNKKQSKDSIFEMQILTPVGTHYIQTTQNMQTKKISSIFKLESSESCVMIDDLQNDTNIIKLDAHLKKTFTALQNYQTLTAALKLEPNFEKYYFAYINEGKKKLIFEIAKKNYLNNFVVSKVDIFGYGYQFEKKDFENISVLLREGNQMNYTNKLSLKKLQQSIKGLMTHYKNYIVNSTLICSLTNETHSKLYVGNPFATFEYISRLTGGQRGQFTILEERKSEFLLPKGFRKQKILKIEEQDQKTKNLRQSIYKRYRGYFGLGNIQVILHRNSQYPEQVEIALKTFLGFFIVKGQNSYLPNSLLASIKKIQTSELPQPQGMCKVSEYFDEIDFICYKRIEGCYRQIGNICIMCSDKYILSSDRGHCKTLCNWQH